MPDRRSHRGPHPEDGELFAQSNWPRLRSAVFDYSWLLTRGYAEPSAMKIVGDRYELNARQRMAIARSACADAALEQRLARQVTAPDVAGQPLWLDGFNVLTTVEVALGGGVVLAARDGACRDIAGVHGTYRNVEETRPAIQVVGQTLQDVAPAECVWFLDSPVGNSGRLKAILLEIASSHGWPWRAELVQNPDPILIAAEPIVATADSVILDRCRHWFNLARPVIARVPTARVIPMT
ncbi:MAG TPA: DUF434 domain-containing protein [Tepidisphaeraceae bacterium]|jgi:hypothetical protein